MKTIRNQLKYLIVVRSPLLQYKELRTAGSLFFMRLQKEQQIDNKQKINKNLAESAFGTVKPYYGHQNMVNCIFCENQQCIM